MTLPNFPNNPTVGQQVVVGAAMYECTVAPSGSSKAVWKLVNQADKSLRGDLAVLSSSVLLAGIKASLLRQFLLVEPQVGDCGSYFNSLLASGIKAFWLTPGSYVFNMTLTVDNTSLKLYGIGADLVQLVRGAGLGTSNIISGQKHSLDIDGIGFNLGKGSYTPTLASSVLENAINSVSPLRLSVTNCSFSDLVNLGISVNGTSVDEAKNINITKNVAKNGTRGFAMVRRYGSNVTIENNDLTNTVDLTNTLYKPIEVSGSVDVWILNNVIEQTNGAGGPLIVEYIDRASVNVHIEGNHYYGPAGECYFKVGAAINVWFKNNHSSGLADIGAYFEGCENLWIVENRLSNTRRNSLILAQDADTGLYNRKVKIVNNHFTDANRNNASAGVPYTATGNPDSYHVWVQDNSEQVELEGNHYSKGTYVAGGIVISSPSYSIKNEDFSKLDPGAVTINNTFHPVGAVYSITDCKQCATTDQGEAVITGAAFTLVSPKIVTQYAPHTLLTLKTALSGSASYVTAEPDVPPKMALVCKNSSHANVTPSSPVTVMWRVDLSRSVKQIMGKTT